MKRPPDNAVPGPSEWAIDPSLPPPFPPTAGSVVTVGTFDGVHRGHREVLDRLVRRARETGERAVLVTFHPHPLRVVRPASAPALLTTPGEKKALLAESGVDAAVFLAFTPTLQAYSPERFVDEILRERLGMRELIIGYDHGFGRGRTGDVTALRRIAAERGFGVEVVGPVGGEADTAISSSKIRRALESGEIAAAERGLGRRYSLEGRVVQGRQLGRTLGFPTANLEIAEADKLLPREGVYAVWSWVGGERIPALLHLGPRPTFEGYPPTVEVHLLDWSGDLYGQYLRVELATYLRPIRPFPSAAALVTAMERDRDEGRWVLVGGA